MIQELCEEFDANWVLGIVLYQEDESHDEASAEDNEGPEEDIAQIVDDTDDSEEEDEDDDDD
jgi:hypothetical protein